MSNSHPKHNPCTSTHSTQISSDQIDPGKIHADQKDSVHRHLSTPCSTEIELQQSTSQDWLECVLENFEDFLIDHAACERKASAVAISMICHYPDRRTLVKEMADLAAEEMMHYREVIRLIHERDIKLTPDTKDPYVNRLRKNVRHGRVEYFQDRLIVAGIVEARGTERFGLIAHNHPDDTMRRFYRRLAESEARHQDLFIRLAYRYCKADQVRARLAELLLIEGQIVQNLATRAALH